MCDGSAITIFYRSVIIAIGEPELRIGFSECFLSVSLDERLLVGDELVEHGIGDFSLGCVNAIVHPRGRRDCYDKKYEMRSFKTDEGNHNAL